MRREGQIRLHVEPITMMLANRYIVAIHRHHGEVPAFAQFAIAAVSEDGSVRGVAVGAFPSAGNRLTDGFRTLEVTRVATDGTPNACSLLYGAAARAAKALGFSRVITYLLEDEEGASVRAAGWTPDEGSFGNLSWADHSQRPGKPTNIGPKNRWSKTFADLARPELKLPAHMEHEDVAQESFDFVAAARQNGRHE